MSVKLMALVFDDYPGPPLEKLTALAVADHADHDGGRIWPTIDALAAKTGNSERTVQRHLRNMEERGWLEVVKHSNGRGSRTEYRMPIERIKGVTVTPFSDPERVTPVSPIKTEKGDNGDTKGCQPRQERVTTETNIVCEPSTEPSTEPSNTLDDEPPKDVSRETYSDDFERFWKTFPMRSGNNPKRRAFKAWQARLRSGVSPDEIQDGAMRYAEFCRHTGKLHTEFIMQAATFLGPDKRYAEPWSAPTGGNHATRQQVGKPSLAERATAARKEFEQREREVVGESVGTDEPHLRPPVVGGLRGTSG